MTASNQPEPPRPPAQEQLMKLLETRSRQLHRAERERTSTFVGSHGSWMGRVYDDWDECPSAPCADDRKLLAALTAAPRPPRRVPEQFTRGGDRTNAGKAWLDGYDTAAEARPPAPDAVRELLEEIEKQLDHLRDVSFGVDVREKFNETRPVISLVVRHSDAMHALLFVRKAAKEAMLSAGVAPDALRELLEQIRAWQDNDRAGYDQAIGLLCRAADTLKAMLSAGVAPDALRELLEEWNKPVDRSMFGSEINAAIYDEARADCAMQLRALFSAGGASATPGERNG